MTILYYTANRISEYFGRKVRDRLVASAPGVPIISISHKPMDFGTNIVHKGPPSCYTLYRQILIGAMNAKTRYVACAEDDSLYPEEHFRFRPSDDTFAYNENRHNLHKEHFVFRD